jgi:hypothetical protein
MHAPPVPGLAPGFSPVRLSCGPAVR